MGVGVGWLGDGWWGEGRVYGRAAVGGLVIVEWGRTGWRRREGRRRVVGGIV